MSALGTQSRTHTQSCLEPCMQTVDGLDSSLTPCSMLHQTFSRRVIKLSQGR